MSYIYSYLNTQKYLMDYILSAHYHIGRQLQFQCKSYSKLNFMFLAVQEPNFPNSKIGQSRPLSGF